MKKIICCDIVMELKAVSNRLSSWDLFFQCQRCGEVVMKRIDACFGLEINDKLREPKE